MRNESYEEARARRKVEAADRLHANTVEVALRVGIEPPARSEFDDYSTAMEVSSGILAEAEKLANPDLGGGDRRENRIT
jgi:hypothetical protein